MKTSKDVDADSVVMVFLASKPGVENDAVIGKPGTVQGATIRVEVPDDAPVGEYELRLVHGAQHTAALGFIVICNPFTCKRCPESAGRSRKQRQEFMHEYVGGEEGLLWQGLSDDYGAHVWQHDPFRAANLLIAISLLADLPLHLRSDPTAISRHLTYVIGERVCYGNPGMTFLLPCFLLKGNDAPKLHCSEYLFWTILQLVVRKWGEGNYVTGQPSNGYRCRTKRYLQRKGTWLSRDQYP